MRFCFWDWVVLIYEIAPPKEVLEYLTGKTRLVRIYIQISKDIGWKDLGNKIKEPEGALYG